MDSTSPAESVVAADVAAILDSHAPAAAAAAAVPSRGRPKLDAAHLSQSPEAIRARRRRESEKAKRQGEPAAQAPTASGGAKFTASEYREPALPPGKPVMVVPSPDDMAALGRATKFMALVIVGAGHLAAAVLKDDGMKVPQADADETAVAILDGWPELAVMDVDGKKWLAVAAVGSLVAERYARHRRMRAVPAVASPPAPTRAARPAAPPPPGLAMEPQAL